jgi:hypothetical protein
MAWVSKFKGLESAFEKQPNSVGNMHGPAAMLHHKTLMPRGNPTDMGSTKGNGPGFGNPTAGALGGKVATTAVQSPAQHAATVKAGMASGMKRRKII